MPIKKSAKKALRQSLKRKVRNLAYKNKLKKSLKEIRKLISLGKKEEAKKLLPSLYKIADKTAKAKVIKKNTASRIKSRMVKLVSSGS
jgi:small subunit ribosomal protein S20